MESESIFLFMAELEPESIFFGRVGAGFYLFVYGGVGAGVYFALATSQPCIICISDIIKTANDVKFVIHIAETNIFLTD